MELETYVMLATVAAAAFALGMLAGIALRDLQYRQETRSAAARMRQQRKVTEELEGSDPRWLSLH